jgi:hypothetical protein
MGVLSDAKVLFEVLNAAGDWLQKALTQARRDRDRRAAHVLHDAFVVVASMRTYDNAFRPLLGQLLAFSIEWEAERRRRLNDELHSAFDTEVILPRLRQALQGLNSSDWEGAGHEPLNRLLNLAFTFGDEVVSPIWVAKALGGGREPIFRALEYGHTPDDARVVHNWAENVASTLNRRLLADADDAFGELRRAVLAAHDLPDPGYAVSLS